MNSVEIFVVILGAVMGYLVVAHFLDRRASRRDGGDAKDTPPKSR